MKERKEREATCKVGIADIEKRLAETGRECEALERELGVNAEKHWVLSVKRGELLLLNGQKTELEILEKEISVLETALNQMSKQKKQKEAAVDELIKQKRILAEELERLEKQQKKQEKEAKALGKEEEEFIKRCREVGSICGETRAYVKEIRGELQCAKKAKEAAEKVLDLLSPIIGETAEAEYRKALQEYLFYESTEGYDFDRMCQTLSENERCLQKVTKQLDGTEIPALERAMCGLREEQEAVEAYSFYGLKLDYGEIPPVENPYDGVEAMVSDKLATGFLAFLTDTEVSDKELELSYLPSGFRPEEDAFTIFSLLGTDMSGIFSRLRTLLPEEVSFDTVIGGVTDAVLFHSYLATHFSNFLNANEAGALSYEWEYLIAGKDTDRENLTSVAVRICAIRTILHFLALYTDSTRKAPAEQAALAVCGFIGLPALKSIAVLLLLFVWALEEAIIDTAALLQGKKLLLYPGKTGGSVSFPEIILFSKDFVSEKAKQKKSATSPAFGYSEFLHLFLCLTSGGNKTYRAADLIQENLRKNYRDTFRINRCVWSVSYTVDGRAYTYAYQ